MAAINFPANPAVNDIFTSGNRSWKFNGVAWALQPKTTDNIAEGSSNLYFTEARVASAPAVTALESRASDIESAASSLDSRVTTAESNISTLSSGLSAEVSNRAAAIDTLTTRVSNIESNIDPAALDSLTEIVTAFQSADGSLAQTVADLAASAGSNLQSEIDRATAAESDLSDRATALEGRSDSLETRATDLEGRATTAESNISTLQSDLDNAEAAASSLTDRVSTAESDIDSLETRASDLEGRATSLESTTSDHETRLQSAEGTIAGLGTMSTQDSDSVSITGGSISGVAISGSSLEVGSGSATANLFVGQSGDVGIGTEAPTEKLSVVGNITATGTVSAASPTEESHLTTKGYVDTATSDLSGRIDSEVSDRESAISTLTDRVANIESNIDPAALDSLTEIVSAFQSADSNINGAITNLADAAAANLQSEVDRATAAEQTLTDSIASVVSGLANSVRTTVLDGLSTASNAVISASDTVLSAFGKLQAQVSAVLSSLNAHTADTSNPHSVTKAQVGLGSADNTSDADKPVSTAQASAIASAKSEAISDSGDYTDTEVATRQIKDVVGTVAPSHEDGRRWVDTTDMTEYLSYGGAWIELDRA
jgi:predicted  nucleic acid-binding Zn-ribbon protein